MTSASLIQTMQGPDVANLLKEVDRRLRIYGQNRHGNLENPLEELVYIILSDQTEEYSFVKTWSAFKKAFPSWKSVIDSPEDKIAATIKGGGLQNKKAKYIKAALETIKSKFGKLSLKKLEEYSDADALKFLQSLSGISVKNARCILMYSFNRKVFPVDTHVWRICRRLGLTPLVPKPTVSQQLELESLVPKSLRYRLHVNMVSHGRDTCTTYWPKCEECVLGDICPSYRKADNVWGEWKKPHGVWKHYEKEKNK